MLIKPTIIKLAGAVEESRKAIWSKFTSHTVAFDTKTSLGIDEPSRMIRSLPTLVLYDDKGLGIFDKITYHADYYLTNSEIEICKKYGTTIYIFLNSQGQEISDYIKDGSVLIELGVGYAVSLS